MTSMERRENGVSKEKMASEWISSVAACELLHQIGHPGSRSDGYW
jgi:hypothetical protein